MDQGRKGEDQKCVGRRLSVLRKNCVICCAIFYSLAYILLNIFSSFSHQVVIFGPGVSKEGGKNADIWIWQMVPNLRFAPFAKYAEFCT